MGVRGLSGGNDLFFRYVFASVRNIVAYRPRKKPCFLKHHAEHFPQAAAGNPVHINSVDFNRTAVRVVETHQQIDDGGFPAAGRPYNRNPLAGSRFQVHILYQLCLRTVGKVHMFHINISLAVRQGQRTGRIRLFFLLVKKVEKPVGRSKRGLNLGDNGGDLVKRFCILIGIGEEGGNLADGQRARPAGNRADRPDYRNRGVDNAVDKTGARVGKG